MRLILTEIKVMDAYERYYSDVPSYIWEEVVGRLQRDRNGNWVDELLPETKWVLKLYKNKSPRLVGDLYKLKNREGDGYIDIFNRAKERRMLQGVQGDLFKYKSIGDLGAFIETLDVNAILGRTKGEQSSDVNSAASNIEVPYEDESWKVVIPKSYDASCYWGSGTRWCTATRETSDWYNEYSSQGPLYIIIDKKTEDKYQFHFESEQFMDKNDRDIDFPIADEIPNWNDNLSNFFINIMEKTGNDDYVLHAESYITGYQNGRKLVRTGLDIFNYKKKEDGKLLLDGGFEKAWDFTKYGLAKVGKDDKEAKRFKYNFIDTDGNLISDQWFDAVEQFRTPYVLVWEFGSSKTNFEEYCNFINTKGELLFPSWFDDIQRHSFIKNFIVAKRKGKWGCFKFDGTMWVDKWFDHVVYDPVREDYVGYDEADIHKLNAEPTPIGIESAQRNNISLAKMMGESKSYSMNDLVYLVEKIMKNLKK
jgi:hypothetical protein